MRIVTHKHAKRFMIVALAISLSALSIGCSISGGAVSGGGGIATNGQTSITIGGTITFKRFQVQNDSDNELIDEDTGNVYTDNGNVDYSQVQATEGTTSGGSVYQDYGSGGGGGGDTCGGDRYCLMQ
jgi:hypothetical protein